MTEQLLSDSRDGLTAVMDAIVSAAGNAGVDDAVLARLRCLHTADEDTLLRSPAELGLDSLTWLEVLTVLEERFDVLLPDAVAVSPESRTVLGLARALADCRRAGR
ncbi:MULTISPECIES: acyl carrier protein [Streptomyces]|uniref:Acyl carrier protein n=1 Tax=Streptomyces nymphaeiformis TaxID=2663842 RepID=A0A7W7XGB6_9ACTN|nr:phosphopantetheine-binding protein [Streptomyces nymphaeiformis]MBB4985953.1 acyl carrier protein [Streptomyces nymphaeiformis]